MSADNGIRLYKSGALFGFVPASADGVWEDAEALRYGGEPRFVSEDVHEVLRKAEEFDRAEVYPSEYGVQFGRVVAKALGLAEHYSYEYEEEED